MVGGFRIVFVMPLRIENRFQGSLRRVFEIEAVRHGIEPVFVDSGYISRASGNDFTDVYMHIYHDADVIREMARLINEWEGDAIPVFWYDVFFTGSLGGVLPLLTMMAKRQGKRMVNIGYIHGGAWCNRDIYHEARYPIFVAMRDISYMLNMEITYTGSNHHKRQILNYARMLIKNHYADLLENNIAVNPIPHMVRVGDYSEKDIDIFIPMTRYQCRREEVIEVAKELENDGYNVYIADNYLGDKYIDILARSKVVIICKDQETYGVAETEAIHNRALPYCPFPCESKEVMVDVHRDLYLDVFNSVGDDLLRIVDNYDKVRNAIDNYLINIKHKYRWLDKHTLIHNTCFFDRLVRDLRWC